MKLISLVFLFLFLILAPAASAEERIELPTRPGVTQPFYLTKPKGQPRASLILFPGGFGTLEHYGPADLRRGNFLVRSRDLFVARGFTVAVMDVPSDERSLSDGFRLGAAHRSDIAAVIAYLRQAANAPVWLVGTSRGTLSAANAATLPAGGADGVVLTSTLLRRAGKRGDGTIFDADPSRITIPVLIVHNREDACPACPFELAADLLQRLARAPRKDLIAVAGGDPPISPPCRALSRHGYLGIEDQVVAAISDWITAR
ncbi:MAG TPA: alpha/beta hydrolase [Stellaceae bacterium]|nr:alpha/beta hydrolase [Stellaceae bacterium]